MKKTNLIGPTIVTLILFSLICGQAESTVTPTWLKNGAFAEYTFRNNSLIFFNGTSLSGDKGSFQWECIDLNASISKFRLSLIITEKNESIVHLTNEVYIRLLDRAVFLKTGTLVGTTNLWLPANPTIDQRIVMWDIPPNTLAFKISNYTGIKGQTPQGVQKSFIVNGIGQVDGQNRTFWVMSDFNTGILIDGELKNDITLKALDVDWLGFYGRLTFANTNIDLGPNERMIDLRVTFPLILVGFVMFFVVCSYLRHKNFKKKKRII